MLAKEIATYMEETGKRETTYGSYIFYVSELAEKFGISESEVCELKEEIASYLNMDEEVLEYDFDPEDDAHFEIYFSDIYAESTL